MIDRERAQRLIATHKARSNRPAQAARVAELCVKLRGIYYPKQRAFFRSPHKRKATKKTRRSGATTGGCRELVARALEHPKFRATYVASTRIEAKARAWESDTSSGFVDVVRQYGTRLERAGVEAYDMAGVVVGIRDGELVLEFSNGSQIDLFGADEERALGKLRGRAKHVFWVDEAQDFRFLSQLYKAVIVGAMTDFDGECWLTGTPGRDCAGMFYEVTLDDGESLIGWEVHRIAAVDNPFFGRVVQRSDEWFVVDNLKQETGPYASEVEAEIAAVAIRWERTAGAAIRENGWSDDDPDLLREWFARWVREDARFVYALHAVPEHQIVYAPPRIDVDGFPDIRAALLDLPERVNGREYWSALGADLGTRAAFAFVIWSWSLADPILYELCSWKKAGLDYDEMASYLHAARAQVNLSLITADAGGGGKPAVMGWSKKWVDRYQLPIIEATKPNKAVAIKMLNNDIRCDRIRLRKNSVLMQEWRVHRWKPLRTDDGKEVEDSTPRDTCFVAGTMIETEHGPCAIEDITIGIRVWTRAGLRSVTAAWCTGERPTWRLDSDAGTLVGTGNHPVWVVDGWIPLSRLIPGCMLTAWPTNMDRVSGSYSTVKSTGDTQSHRLGHLECTTAVPKIRRCTVRFGNTSVALFRRVITYITSMVTLPTIGSKTSPWLMEGNTSAIICVPRSDLRPVERMSSTRNWPPRPGIVHRKVGLGTPSTLELSWRAVRSMIAFVWSVVTRLSRRYEAPGFAACAVMPGLDATPELMTSKGHAQSAEASSNGTGTREVPIVLRRVVEVRSTGAVEPVYNLTVCDRHEYFANGVLVSNCDAGLYAHRESYHHRYREPPPIVTPGSPEWVIREEKELEDATFQSYR